VFDALIYGKDGQVPGACQPAVIEHRLQAPQNARRPVGESDNLINKRRPRQVKHVPGDCRALMAQQVICLRSQNLAYLLIHLLLLRTH
jgi:hypothetical protein